MFQPESENHQEQPELERAHHPEWVARDANHGGAKIRDRIDGRQRAAFLQTILPKQIVERTAEDECRRQPEGNLGGNRRKGRRRHQLACRQSSSWIRSGHARNTQSGGSPGCRPTAERGDRAPTNRARPSVRRHLRSPDWLPSWSSLPRLGRDLRHFWSHCSDTARALRPGITRTMLVVSPVVVERNEGVSGSPCCSEELSAGTSRETLLLLLRSSPPSRREGTSR